MSSPALVGAAVLVFIVVALMFYQSHAMEGFENWPARVPHFQNSWASWNPSQPPIAGRLYDPAAPVNDTYPVPADLSKAPVTQPYGTVPLSQRRPDQTPGTGTTTAPREAMAQARDLYELDVKILVWLAAVSQKEREQPGSLTPEQLERRVMLQGRHQELLDQLGTGMIVDTFRRVTEEIKEIRRENMGWQQMSPSLEAVYDFGRGKNPNAFLTHDEYVEFYGLFNAGILEMEGVAQPDPLQRVRLQQLQIMRQDLIDNSRNMETPPIKMAAAQLYLRQMLRPDQPLPTLFSMEPPPFTRMEDRHDDVMDDLRNMQWKVTLNVRPMMDQVRAGKMSPNEARHQIATMKMEDAPAAYGDPAANWRPDLDKKLIERANRLCTQIGEAFPEDAEALGCSRRVETNNEAETVINTVCDRLRYSVPTVSPEQFDCPQSA